MKHSFPEWQISFPDDWSKDFQNNENKFEFISNDQSKNLYLSFLTKNNVKPIIIFLKNCLEEEKNILIDGSFVIVNEEVVEMKGTTFASLISWDGRTCYLIIVKYIYSNDKLSRITYHNYDCQDIELAIKECQRITESFQYN